ncbi:MAG TPA: OmpA family protein, partial [Gemmatimonadaceae bacterium]|nr:OmpA family protein [Gemmatimonadaceae bacterium]
VIGNQTGSTARGAIIGAVIGGASGAIIGHQMDQQAKELDQSIEGAQITRVGEGIAVTFDSGILFPFNSTDILPAGRENLQKLAQSLDKYPNSDILIVGHTDSVGTDAYNSDLSQRRANAAGSYLQSLGVAPGRLRMTGRGETEPVQSNDTDAGRQANRRVEIAIFASEAYRNQVKSGSQ